MFALNLKVAGEGKLNKAKKNLQKQLMKMEKASVSAGKYVLLLTNVHKSYMFP